ncbi:MAG TPA: hypothetical protein VE618_05860 [Myxococcaceae bacterium]|nr:hypothetical protein [Myxococcaceae bacterium]
MRAAGILSTVILDPPTALLFGCAVALVSARLIARHPETELMRTGMLGAAWGVLYGLSVGWFFFHRPDWMLAYLKDAREVSLIPAYAVFLGVLAAHGAAGALANAALLRRGLRAAAWALTAGVLLTLAATFWLQWRQYLAVGTFEEFWSGRAAPIQSDAVMQRAMNVSGAISAVSAVAIFIARFLQARRLAPSGAADGRRAA